MIVAVGRVHLNPLLDIAEPLVNRLHFVGQVIESVVLLFDNVHQTSHALVLHDDVTVLHLHVVFDSLLPCSDGNKNSDHSSDDGDDMEPVRKPDTL